MDYFNFDLFDRISFKWRGLNIDKDGIDYEIMVGR